MQTTHLTDFSNDERVDGNRVRLKLSIFTPHHATPNSPCAVNV